MKFLIILNFKALVRMRKSSLGAVEALVLRIYDFLNEKPTQYRVETYWAQIGSFRLDYYRHKEFPNRIEALRWAKELQRKILASFGEELKIKGEIRMY